LALSQEEGFAKFYLKGKSADSSLIDNGSSNFTKIRTIRFEEYYNKYLNGEVIKLFKCDAEGAEPEVIQGLGKSINFIEYIAIDCGPERGLKKEKTDEFVSKFLVKNNFTAIKSNRPNNRGILIYKNRRLEKIS
jgi:hypothetical protein